MRDALWLLFSPFAMVGGFLLGWFGHDMALQQAAGTFVPNLANLPDQMILLGFMLIILGGFIRHFMMSRMKKKMKQQSATLATDQGRIDEANQTASVATQRLQVIRDMITELREDDLRTIMSDDLEATLVDAPIPPAGRILKEGENPKRKR